MAHFPPAYVPAQFVEATPLRSLRLASPKMEWQIAQCMLSTSKFLDEPQLVKDLCLPSPDHWKPTLFTQIMKQELEGGSVKYSSDSLKATHIKDE